MKDQPAAVMAWRVWADGVAQDALVPIEGLDAAGQIVRRERAAIRGGISWPSPRLVGTRVVAEGALVVVGFVPGARPAGAPEAQTMAEILAWWSFAAMLPTMQDGWPIEPGAATWIRRASGEFRCGRYYAFATDDEMVESVRVIRQAMAGDFGGVRLTGIGADTDRHDLARAAIWRWRGRITLDDALLQAVAREEAEYVGTGPLAHTEALAAALSGYERTPWRPGQQEPWRKIDKGIANQPLQL